MNDKDQWNPVIAIKPNGTQLFVGYYDRSADNNDLIYMTGRIVPLDSSGTPTSYGTAFRVSSAGFPIIDVGEEADYDTAAADDGAFYVSWSDNRNRMRISADPNPSIQANEANVRFTKIPAP